MLVSGGPTLPLSPFALELERRAGGREGLLANLADLVGGGAHRHPGCQLCGVGGDGRAAYTPVTSRAKTASAAAM